MIYVTHDQIEAMTLGERIVVMKSGEIQQIDTPMKLYEKPANVFVAGFVGSPAMNFFRGRVTTDDGVRLALGSTSLKIASAAGERLARHRRARADHRIAAGGSRARERNVARCDVSGAARSRRACRQRDLSESALRRCAGRRARAAAGVARDRVDAATSACARTDCICSMRRRRSASIDARARSGRDGVSAEGSRLAPLLRSTAEFVFVGAAPAAIPTAAPPSPLRGNPRRRRALRASARAA